MSTILESVRDLVGQFISDSKFVFIDNEKIGEVAKDIKNWKDKIVDPLWGFPKCIKDNDPYKIEKLVLYELIANSINYCYWYGRSDIRPNGASATKMYELLDASFREVLKDEIEALSHPGVYLDLQSIKNLIAKDFAKRLVIERFPMLGQRAAHLKEIKNLNFDKTFLPLIERYKNGKGCGEVEEWIEILVQNIPGFAADPFLKRAILFVMQLYRGTGFFGEEQIKKLPVPADYQIPKMLRYLGCIQYETSLLRSVMKGDLIPEGSQMECEIRAATIVVCSMIAEEAKCTCEVVDTYLWSKRNECKEPFHLTVTANY